MSVLFEDATVFPFHYMWYKALSLLHSVAVKLNLQQEQMYLWFLSTQIENLQSHPDMLNFDSIPHLS